MGHVTSKDLNQQPFVVDLESGKGATRLAVIALTEENIGGENSKIFQAFYSTRCQDSVRHWYCAPPDRSTLPTCPQASFVYQKFVREPSTYVRCQPDSCTPLPVVIVKLSGNQPEHLPTVADVLSSDVEVVGYFGARQFNGDGSVDDYAVLGMFLSRDFQNESKSGPILEIVAACYAHYAAKAQMDLAAVLPSMMQFTTLETNLPCLRMIQKFISQNASLLDSQDLFIQRRDQGRVICQLRAPSIARLVASLATRVTSEDGRTWRVGHDRPDRLPDTTVHQVLDDLIVAARDTWKDANRAAHENKPKRPAPMVVDPIDEISTSGSSKTEATPPQSARKLPAPMIHSRPGPQSQSAPRMASNQSPYQQEMPPALSRFIVRKRTPVMYAKEGNWVRAQWRSEKHEVTLASQQPYLDNGWLCLQPLGRSDIEIFKHDHIPATARIERGIFFADYQGVLALDSSGQRTPFQVQVGMVAAPQPPAMHYHPRSYEQQGVGVSYESHSYGYEGHYTQQQQRGFQSHAQPQHYPPQQQGYHQPTGRY